MRDFRVRTDLQRVVIDGFALPLGFVPAPGTLKAPTQGYTVAYAVGEEDDADTYSFHVVVTHERLREVLNKAFALLPDEVYGIIEIGSRDAYRATDVYLGDETIKRGEFLRIWKQFEPFLLEDGAVAAGANSEEPFIEVFLDQWKGVTIHVPADRREQVEHMLQTLGLHEVPETWSEDEQDDSDERIDDVFEEKSSVRPVLDTTDEYMPDVDELLLQLRHAWRLELNVDPRTNVDESGRNLGPTLWYAVVIAHDAAGKSENGAYVSVWATAGSLAEMEKLIEEAMSSHPEWEFGDIYTIDRVAFDERPEELADLKPNDRRPRVHAMSFDKWNEPPQPPRPPETSRHQR
jgi:hypothetical protein